MFINNIVLSWEKNVDGWSPANEEWKHAYTYLDHAENLILHEKTNFLIDSISNLKRSIDHRMKLINKNYKIKKTSFYQNNKSIISALSEIGIVRPIMLNNLVKLRNYLEHQFGNPPDKERCKEFSEIVWYFLKSTDTLVMNIQDAPERMLLLVEI